MNSYLDFISDQDFKNHIRDTIKKYGVKLEPYDVEKFNSNIIDPIKMLFDRAVYRENWENLISNEIFRQRDKSNTNEIGYFHQGLFKYINNCCVPANGEKGGWDVIYEPPEGYSLDGKVCAKTIYVEMKNKHNTMNSAASGKTYIKMQNQILNDDSCFCFLVEVIARQSQNVSWAIKVDGQNLCHKLIRRVSIDKFFEIVTGQSDAFFRVCMALPQVVEEVLLESNDVISTPHDLVYEQLRKNAKSFVNVSEDTAMILSMYMLGFSSYNGFR